MAGSTRAMRESWELGRKRETTIDESWLSRCVAFLEWLPIDAVDSPCGQNDTNPSVSEGECSLDLIRKGVQRSVRPRSRFGLVFAFPNVSFLPAGSSSSPHAMLGLFIPASDLD